MSNDNKLRIIVLHGMHQNAEIIRTRIGRLPHKSRHVVQEFHIKEGPHILDLKEGDDVALRSWYLRDTGTNVTNAESLNQSLALLESEWKTSIASNNPFHGVFGFSMGGTMAALMATMPSRFPMLRFVVCVGAPDNPLINIIDPTVEALLMAGEADKEVAISRTRSLAQKFSTPPLFIAHPQGHCIPSKAEYVSTLVSFFETQQKRIFSCNQLSLPSSSTTTLSAQSVITVPTEQNEEVETLLAIYGSDVIKVQTQPPDAQLNFSVILSEQISLNFIIPPTYPKAGSIPQLSLCLGDLSLAEFPSSKQRALLAIARKEAESHCQSGDVYAFSIISACQDWLSSGQDDDAITLVPYHTTDGHAVPPIAADNGSNSKSSKSIPWYECEEIEEEESKYIAIATHQAEQMAFKYRSANDTAFDCSDGSSGEGDGERSVDSETEEIKQHEILASASARGLWKYTIGLCGKPSAGKSTFYNCATRAVLERDGRLMAAVAPHPFTTIEPNIGPGWFASTDPRDELVAAASHGRDDKTNKRLLPVIIKDVAGLVPGAYKGRGKGNRFLADLTDADVLVHVVDATGRSDKDGNLIIDDRDEACTSPTEDAKWIREELHRWIHGNVKAKWGSLFRKGKEKTSNRIFAVFSGYKGTKAVLYKAAARAGLDLDKGQKWTALDLHKLVANYLMTRFPIALALNKIDAFPDQSKCTEVLSACQEEARARGEVAVPVCAMAEAWHLQQLASSLTHSLMPSKPSIQLPESCSNQKSILTSGYDKDESKIVNNNLQIQRNGNERDRLTAAEAYTSGEKSWRISMERIGDTGVLAALSSAVSLRPPTYVYPVSCLETMAPVAWKSTSSSMASSDIHRENSIISVQTPRLRDCLLFKPGSSVGDVFEALKRGALPHAIVQGEFVRAEARSLTDSTKKQLGRDTVSFGAMLVLFETPAGYALFKVLKPGKLEETDKIWEEFTSVDKASSIVKLKAFSPFENTTEAVVAATSIIESSLDKSLKKFLKKTIVNKEITDELAVSDLKLGGLIKEKLAIQCVCNEAVSELFRGIRNQMDGLLGGTEGGAMKAMQLGLSHSLSRYKLKFSADKVDIMVVQAIGLLDDLDKEINMYAMRVREWYGWHFPEMAKIMNDNMFYAKCVKRMGMRTNCKNCDFSDILGDEILEETFKKAAETSMGTEISDSDLINIVSLCDQVIQLSVYRIQLFDYLKNRMAAIAPNLTVMVGELVGARLIAHAGSLLNLAKHPASTIQILGAEKALFRALKTKHDTPKYGLIYHASLIGQTTPKNKGKISRVLAAKTALAIRVDALGESTGATIAIENRVKVESRIRQLEGGQVQQLAAPKTPVTHAKYDATAARALAPPKYNPASDAILTESNGHNVDDSKKMKKRKTVQDEPDASQDAVNGVEEAEAHLNGDAEKKKKKKKVKSSNE